MKLGVTAAGVFLLFHLGQLISTTAEAADPTITPPQNGAPPQHCFLLAIDPDLSMRSGTVNLLTAHTLLSRVEDRLLRTTWSNESSLVTRTAGIAGRLTKLALLDLPVDYFTVVLAHEYFGHGARYRELNIGNIDYGYDRPPPYGNGGGWATASIHSGSITDSELLAICTGGLEVHQQLNDLLRRRWVRSGYINYREALLYFWSFQIGFNYLQGSTPITPELEDYNDPQAYIQLLNRINGYNDVTALQYRLEDLQKQMKADLFDPFLFLAIYTQLTSYFWRGEPETSFPMLLLGDVTYLPLLRTSLTPFGLAYHLDNYLLFDNHLVRVDLGLGDDTFQTGWGSIGVLVEELVRRPGFQLDLRLDAWKQPRLDLSGQSISGSGNGGACSLRGHYQLPTSRLPLFGIVEAGFKSRGFLEGYSLDRAPNLMLGLALKM
ncbi:MAG: hypothetical protein ISR91_01000 [Candidatus Delongbacteria bacterium]|nr:hypothetical protein [Candidatus Delongbacteria bacterium]